MMTNQHPYQSCLEAYQACLVATNVRKPAAGAPMNAGKAPFPYFLVKKQAGLTYKG
ncbi:hypothetical protein [Larkinella sp.]|uniref:hypothetical protein n=1 Tax=Larkinella sp. TaxID=2034517 RepID=UPI003BA91B60